MEKDGRFLQDNIKLDLEEMEDVKARTELIWLRIETVVWLLGTRSRTFVSIKCGVFFG